MKGISEQATDFQDGLAIVTETINALCQNPKRWAVVCPRSYANQPGYFNPRLDSGFMAIYLEFMAASRPNKVEIDCILSSWKICENLVPTFFVGQEFAEALVCTQPPENMVLGDLKWPFDGMVFVLPEKFQREHFGTLVPFVRAARMPARLHRPPPMIQEAYGTNRGFGLEDSDYGEYAIIVTATVMEHGRPVDYSGSFRDKDSLGMMMSDARYDKFYKDQERALQLGYTDLGSDTKDLELLKKIIALVGHLLLAMNAVPEQIEAPTVVFPLKEKVQKRTPTKNWTWNPHFLGRHYRWQREKVEHGGTHASPRLHPRIGHWRHQLIGPRFEDRSLRQHKVIWIRPTLVGAKPERTDDAKTT